MIRTSNLATFAVALLLLSTIRGPAGSVFAGSLRGEEEPPPPPQNEKKIKSDAPWIGIYFESIPLLAAKKLSYPHETGIVLSKVIEGSPAERAGLREGDVVYRFAGTVVKDQEHFLELVRMQRPGDRVVVEIFRRGDERTTDLVLGSQSDRKEALSGIGRYEEALKAQEKAMRELSDFYSRSYMARGRIGLRLRDLNDDLASYFGVDRNKGVLVLDVDGESAASRAGIKAGDVIVAVNGSPVSVSDDVVAAIGEVEPGDTVSIEIIRKGAKETFDVAVDEALPENYRIFIAPLGGDEKKAEEEFRKLQEEQAREKNKR